MKQNIIYIGLDVDDTQYHGSAFNKDTGEVIDFKSRPTLKGPLQQLDRMARHFKGLKIKLCYEASYVGYSLQRDLVSNGIHCDIVSPSSIPSPRGKAIKTDRIDAGYLAQFYANDLLTIVQPPDEEQEQDRDLLRSRQKIMQQRNQLRKHLQAVLRRSGLHYKAETQYKSHWTKHHYFWLARTIDGLSGSLKINLELLLRQLKALNEILTEYGQQIEVLANTPRYQSAVHSLTCYKGIKNIFALTMITEIGDIKRFSHPRKLVSWIGMDIREYSSGGKHNRLQATVPGRFDARRAGTAGLHRPAGRPGSQASAQPHPISRRFRAELQTPQPDRAAARAG